MEASARLLEHLGDLQGTYEEGSGTPQRCGTLAFDVVAPFTPDEFSAHFLIFDWLLFVSFSKRYLK